MAIDEAQCFRDQTSSGDGDRGEKESYEMNQEQEGEPSQFSSANYLFSHNIYLNLLFTN